MLVPKSRQVMASWLFVSLYLWDALFFPSRLTFIQSKKEEDADQLLERAWIMYQRLPEFIRLWQPAAKTFCHIRFKRNRSHLWALSQGAEHVRSYTPTGVLSDEAAFQEDVDKVLAAVGPALGAKGRLTMISSPAPSFFKMLCFDES